jgi:hypothetical protein
MTARVSDWTVGGSEVQPIASRALQADACSSDCWRAIGYLATVTTTEANPVPDGGQPIGRAALHRQAREQVRQFRRAVRQYRKAERRYQRAILRARGPQQQERIQQRMHGTPVEELARNSRVNTPALRGANVNTAADVSQCTARYLESIRGIGPKSAQKIKRLANDLARTRPGDIRPPANPNTWNPADYALVRTLVMLAAVIALAPHAAVLQQVLLASSQFERPSTRKIDLGPTQSDCEATREAAE